MAELFIAHHYALAVVGITPIALIGGALASGNTEGILDGRIFDTLLGSVVAVVVFALSSAWSTRLTAAVQPRGEQTA